jgi:hypothetical protein
VQAGTPPAITCHGDRTPGALDEECEVMELLDAAEALSFRLAQQEQWQQAAAVQEGRQPRVDPDGAELEEIDEGTRIYRPHEVYRMMGGRKALVAQRIVKRLDAGGHWENDVIVDSYRQFDGAAGAGWRGPGASFKGH